MTDIKEFLDADEQAFDPARIAYIKPTGTEEARKLGIVPRESSCLKA